MNDAIKLWLKTHKCGPGFVPIDGVIQKNGLPVVLFYKAGDAMEWSVQYAGNGHYFETREDALDYIRSRRWKWTYA